MSKAPEKTDFVDEQTLASKSGIGDVVASHYNNLQERGKAARSESRIFHLRNLNNWIKSMLINEYSNKVKEAKARKREADRNFHDEFNVLDIGCGKGGDLLKWDEAGINNLVCADIAETSVTVDARERYKRMLTKRRRNGGQHFKADFIAADCTKTRLLNLYPRKDLTFDIVSCQFAFHYCFESLEQAECMIRNASERLKPGGFFIGTVPDSTDLMARAYQAGSNSIGNSVYSVTFDQKMLDDHKSGERLVPLFGAKYMFHLEGVVDCPEFLVHFPTLEKLAEKFGLILVGKRRFENYFNQFKEQGRDLLLTMSALERFPPKSGESLKGEDVEDNYACAKDYKDKHPESGYVGTISREEWEALTVYQIFAFKKLS